MFGILGTPEILLIALLVLVLFGATIIPRLARSLGRARAEFRGGRQATDAARGPDADSPGGAPETRRVESP